MAFVWNKFDHCATYRLGLSYSASINSNLSKALEGVNTNNSSHFEHYPSLDKTATPSLEKVRYLLGGGWAGASEGRVISNGGGSRLLNLWKSGEGHAFRFRKHKICKISNAFSAIQEAQISKFSGGPCPRTPYLPNASTFTLILSHSIKHVSHSMVHYIRHIFHSQFPINLSEFRHDTLRTSWHPGNGVEMVQDFKIFPGEHAPGPL